MSSLLSSLLSSIQEGEENEQKENRLSFSSSSSSPPSLSVFYAIDYIADPALFEWIRSTYTRLAIPFEEKSLHRLLKQTECYSERGYTRPIPGSEAYTRLFQVLPWLGFWILYGMSWIRLDPLTFSFFTILDHPHARTLFTELLVLLYEQREVYAGRHEMSWVSTRHSSIEHRKGLLLHQKEQLRGTANQLTSRLSRDPPPLRSSPLSVVPRIRYSSDGTIHYTFFAWVVGLSYFSQTRTVIGQSVEIRRPTPASAADPSLIVGPKIGYLEKRLAKILSPALDSGSISIVRARLREGHDPELDERQMILIEIILSFRGDGEGEKVTKSLIDLSVPLVPDSSIGKGSIVERTWLRQACGEDGIGPRQAWSMVLLRTGITLPDVGSLSTDLSIRLVRWASLVYWTEILEPSKTKVVEWIKQEIYAEIEAIAESLEEKGEEEET